VPEPCDFEVELAIEKLKRHESGIDQIPTELINAGGRRCEVHKHINSIWNKEELAEEWESFIAPVQEEGDKTGCSNYRGISHLTTTYKILCSVLLQG
jgi:23S rRNA A2030 N6-methylase RlmJ